MRNLVIVLLLFGFIVGLAPLSWYLISEWTNDLDDVVYSGSYEPLRGVEMSTAYSSELDKSFDRRTQGLSTLWLYLVPIATSILGALTGVVLHKRGFVLTRRRSGEA
ncbi:hypothetical protein [Rhodococcus sp. 06-235-1A]|uniref:hypothetical protein n=1 Tax=Rhodococcus sp. 06-235-1A TaxID=2022508 RepID=UPI00117A8C06|nr:hypothetical protein [Rhodococcus sp. 06-235-1A]